MRRTCIIRLAACFASLLAAAARCEGQEPIHITFDGPPPQPPGTAYTIQQYNEAGMSFNPFRSWGFGRVGSNPPSELPDNGTAYLQAALGDSLMLRFTNGSPFNLMSVDLAEYSTVVPGKGSVLTIDNPRRL